ncbi:MAG: hypothetical protein ACRDTC_15530 [Pseudonocardiaceae bacterium]
MADEANADEQDHEASVVRSAIDVSAFTAPALRDVVRSAIDVSAFTAPLAIRLAEIVDSTRQDPSLRLANHAEVVPRRLYLTEADRRALQRAAVFIVVGIVVILAMELAPEASAKFGAWLGTTGGLTALIWYLMDQNRQS